MVILGLQHKYWLTEGNSCWRVLSSVYQGPLLGWASARQKCAANRGALSCALTYHSGAGKVLLTVGVLPYLLNTCAITSDHDTSHRFAACAALIGALHWQGPAGSQRDFPSS